MEPKFGTFYVNLFIVVLYASCDDDDDELNETERVFAYKRLRANNKTQNPKNNKQMVAFLDRGCKLIYFSGDRNTQRKKKSNR